MVLRKRHTPATVGRYLPTYLETLLNSPSKRFTLLLLSLARRSRSSRSFRFSSDYRTYVFFLLIFFFHLRLTYLRIVFAFFFFFFQFKKKNWLIFFGQVRTRCSIRCSGNDDACCNHAEYRLCNTSGTMRKIYIRQSISLQ